MRCAAPGMYDEGAVREDGVMLPQIRMRSMGGIIRSMKTVEYGYVTVVADNTCAHAQGTATI